MEWIECSQRLPETKGDYLILFDASEPDQKKVDIDVATFYPAGSIIGHGAAEIEGTPEIKLLDSIFNRLILAGEDGFYNIYDDVKPFLMKPMYWAELPEAPEGFSYRVV